MLVDSHNPLTPPNRLMPTEGADAKISADDTFMGSYKRCLPDTAKTCSTSPRGGAFNYYTPNSELITRAAFSPQTVLIFINNTAVEHRVHAAALYLYITLFVYVYTHTLTLFLTHTHTRMSRRPPPTPS